MLNHQSYMVKSSLKQKLSEIQGVKFINMKTNLRKFDARHFWRQPVPEFAEFYTPPQTGRYYPSYYRVIFEALADDPFLEIKKGDILMTKWVDEEDTNPETQPFK